jgi:hypothetical protein
MHLSGRGRCPVVLLLSFFTLTASQVPLPSKQVIPQAEVERHIRFLASDELMGRKAGTEGDHVAERYIAEHFRACGLSPAPGLKDFLQPVPLTKVQPPDREQVRIAGVRLQPSADFILLQGENCRIDAEVKDVGEGSGESQPTDQFDLRRKVAVTRTGTLDAYAVESFRKKAELLQKRGALAILALYDGDRWDDLRSFLAGPRFRIIETQPENSIPYIVVRDQGGALEQELERPGVHQAQINLSRRRVEGKVSANVIGILPGRDPVLKEQFVGLTAHFDHLGQDPHLPGATKQDSIFNGARDNGMGVTAVLAAATVLAKDPPARSLVFIAFTAEEEGMLGSSYYVQNPAVPLEKTVFVLNSDGAGYTDTSAVTVLGLDRTTASKEIVEGCREFGLEAIAGGPDLQMFFNGSDNRNFAQKGVPAPTFSPGFRNFGPEILKYYHRPSDQADENFDFAYLERFCEAYVRCAQLIAERPDRPKWEPGDKFEKVAAKLYGER